MKGTYNHHFGELPFAVKEHWATRVHHDLRLKWNGVLLSWAMPVGSSWRVGEARTAMEMEDHDAANILFEGVHKTGPIMVWDYGTWEPCVEHGGVLPSLESGFLRFTLRGEKLHGIFTLSRKEAAKKAQRATWILRKEAELFSESDVRECVLERWANSIFTGRSMEQIVQDWEGRKPLRQPNLFGWA